MPKIVNHTQKSIKPLTLSWHRRMLHTFPSKCTIHVDTPKEILRWQRYMACMRFELRPGADPAEFEKLVSAPVVGEYEGWTVHLLKGERGERKGKYLVLVEIESIAARDRYSPAPNTASAEADPINARNAAYWERWHKLATQPGNDTVYTDYVVVGP